MRRRKQVEALQRLHQYLLQCAYGPCEGVGDLVCVAWAAGKGPRRTEARIFAVCKAHREPDMYLWLGQDLLYPGDLSDDDAIVMTALDTYPWEASSDVLLAMQEAGMLPQVAVA